MNRYWSRFSRRPCHSSGGLMLASHCNGPGSSPGRVMWNLSWTKWQWGSSKVSPAKHSIDCSTPIIIIYHLWIQSRPTPRFSLSSICFSLLVFILLLLHILLSLPLDMCDFPDQTLSCCH